jgi:ATP-dependent Clp protease protease subunit|uniref:ATP-dependent Clp protease proteolytic subunit 1 n=1 Tax=Juncus roemerianus TaxID=879918 RepID=UPI00237A3DC9|nr:ATP-dependent Clp protease proteolytic subunit 1 [Juncus roemerianus]UZM11274.1 ATP-dependent Clp protease proteolytic subunit 1 [Juncus roemerianus]
MTIGVPKIPLNPPGAKETIWVEIDEVLYRGRLLLLFGEIDSDMVIDFVSLLLLLGVDDDDIFLFINSPGGDIQSGITIYDTMKTLIPDVCTLVIGLAASVASLLLSGGTYNKRLGFPHARVMIQQPVTDSFSASAEIMASEAEKMFRLRSTIADIYAKNTGKPVSVIQQDLERDKYMSVTEAQEYGIIDKVTKETKKWYF